jgi:hypothetical protein
MDSSNSPQSSIQFITLDDLFNSFNGNGMWLNSSIKQFVEDEDAILVENAPSWTADNFEDDDFEIVIRSKSSAYGNRIRISFSAYGFRRGVLLMEDMLPDFPKQESGLSNWYLGFTVAGNGTPAYIFPVNDDISHVFASQILRKALL